MTDKKLTDDNEIIENLTEFLITATNGYSSSLENGGIIDEYQEHFIKTLTDSVNLINCQKAQIEKLNIQLQELWKRASLYKAESERWEDYNKNLLTANTALSNEILEAKTESYKEFAERLKSYLLLNKKGEMSVISFENIDYLLKEMVGEEENDL